MGLLWVTLPCRGGRPAWVLLELARHRPTLAPGEQRQSTGQPCQPQPVCVVFGIAQVGAGRRTAPARVPQAPRWAEQRLTPFLRFSSRDRVRGAERVPGEIKARQGPRTAGSWLETPPGGKDGGRRCPAPSLVAHHQVSVRVGGCHGHGAPWREAGCAVNPTSGHGVLGTESRGPAWRVPAGLGAAPCPQGLQKSLTAAFNDDRTDLTLPRGCWALGVWPSPTMVFLPTSSPWM